MTKPQRICSIEDCDRPTRARGWCATHWKRWRTHGNPAITFRIVGGDVLDRLSTKFTIGDGCWEWTAKAKNRHGYGEVRDDDGKTRRAYLVLYRIMVGPVPDGLELDHTCRNVLCVRPDHMEPVTHRENVLRGVGPTAVNAQKTHCSKCGRPLSGENLRIDKGSGSRRCRNCANAAARRSYVKRHGAVRQ